MHRFKSTQGWMHPTVWFWPMYPLCTSSSNRDRTPCHIKRNQRPAAPLPSRTPSNTSFLLPIDPPDPSCQLHILRHDRNPLPVYGAQIAILEQRHKMRLGGLLQRQYRAPLPPVRLAGYPGLYLAYQPGEGQASQQQVRGGLVRAYLAQRLFSGAHPALFAYDARPLRLLLGRRGEATLGLVAGTGAAEEGFVAGTSGVGGGFGSGHCLFLCRGVEEAAEMACYF
mmetsp:Transcript_17444/g.41922  ORF Transcript_17444/g.41922 Transcript_17444/m.41922 type:complete len:225 (+) Transcript_17444:95-769(+)